MDNKYDNAAYNMPTLCKCIKTNYKKKNRIICSVFVYRDKI